MSGATIAGIAAGVAQARKMGQRICPDCHKPLERMQRPYGGGIHWQHPCSFVQALTKNVCDYSEPEASVAGEHVRGKR